MKKQFFITMLLLAFAAGAIAQCAAPVVLGTPKWSGKDKTFYANVQYDPSVSCYAVKISHDKGATWSNLIRQQGSIQPAQGKVIFGIASGSTVYSGVVSGDYMIILACCDGVIPSGSVDPNILTCGNTTNFSTPTAPIVISMH